VAEASFFDIRIKGIAAAVPKLVVNNMEAHPFVGLEEKQKTIKLTGMLEYRKASPDICASDLCQRAAEILFSSMNFKQTDIDAVIFVTQTPDYRMPSTACILQSKLGCRQSTVAFDINLGCSGFIYGLYTAASFISGGGLSNVLLLCGDTQSKLSYEKDKNVCFIMGDAGTATLISRDHNASPINMVLMTDGNRYDKLIVPAGGFRNPSSDETREIKIQPDGGLRSKEHVYMEGMDIFNFSSVDVVNTIKEFLNKHQINIENIDYLVLHQANKFMTDKIARKLKFPSEKVLYSLGVFGNTSCASIPLTIVHHFSKNGRGTKRCILSGFGVGLSWGVADVVLDQIDCPSIVEV